MAARREAQAAQRRLKGDKPELPALHLASEAHDRLAMLAKSCLRKRGNSNSTEVLQARLDPIRDEADYLSLAARGVEGEQQSSALIMGQVVVVPELLVELVQTPRGLPGRRADRTRRVGSRIPPKGSVNLRRRTPQVAPDVAEAIASRTVR